MKKTIKLLISTCVFALFMQGAKPMKTHIITTTPAQTSFFNHENIKKGLLGMAIGFGTWLLIVGAGNALNRFFTLRNIRRAERNLQHSTNIINDANNREGQGLSY